MDSPKQTYTFLYKDGRTREVTLTKEEMQIVVRKSDEIAFCVDGTDIERYIFVKGVWSIKPGKHGGPL